MSTILKALKKVERKRAASTVKLNMPKTPVFPTVKRSNGPTWLVAAGLSLVVVLSVVTGSRILQTDTPAADVQKMDEAVGVANKKAIQPPTIEKPASREILSDKLGMKPVPTEPELPLKRLQRAKETAATKPLSQEVLVKKPVIKPTPTLPDTALRKPEGAEAATVPNPSPEKSSAQLSAATPNFQPQNAVEKTNNSQQGGKDPLAKKQPPKALIAKSEPKKKIQPPSLPKTLVQPDTAPKTDATVTRKPKKADIPVLEDRSLEIQALVYSADAAKRMIVLNGEILRQGYAYKGYTIEAIESQRVLVRKKGKVSALPFGK